MRHGVIVRNPARRPVMMGDDAVTDVLLCSSAFKRFLKSSDGRSSSPAAIAVSPSIPPASTPPPANRESMAWFSCSTSSRSGMAALHLRLQVLDRPKLKLLHRAFAPLHLLGNLTDALLLHEAQVNHPILGFGEPLHQLKQHG